MTQTSKRTRGRPRASNTTKQKDAAIAKTVYRLLAAGWSGRSRPRMPGVFEIVGLEAEAILGRTDGDRGELGPDRVEQIYEVWRNAEIPRRRNARAWPLIQVSKWKVGSLRDRAPRNVGNTLRAQTQVLLRNGGEWPPTAHFRYGLGDMEPAPKHQEWIDETMPRWTFSKRSPTDEEQRQFAERFIAGALAAQKNGVEK